MPVDDLAQVVGRDVRGHADGDPRAAVDEEVRELGRQDLGHGQALVVVGDEVDRVLLDVGQHLAGQLGHPDLGVPHGRRRVAVDRAEVALAVDEEVAQAEILGHPDQGVVGRLVAVGMVFADDVADDAGRFLVGLVPRRPGLVHGVEDAAVDGLQAVLDVGDGPADDDAHGVVEVGPLHLVLEADDGDLGGHGHGRLFVLGGLRGFGLLGLAWASSLSLSLSLAIVRFRGVGSDVQVLGHQGVVLDELLAAFDLVAHQDGEDARRP